MKVTKIAIRIQDMQRPPCWNELHGNNSAIIERVCSKVDTDR